MRRLIVLAALFALPAPALAQEATVPAPEPQQPEAEAPAPAAGKLTLRFLNGLRDGDRAYAAKGQRLKVRGSVRPHVVGQYVKVELRRDGKTVATKVRRVREGGRFVVRFKPRTVGRHVVRAQHKRTPKQGFFSAAERVRVLDNTAGYGARGIRVKMLQRGLRRLGYAGLTVNGSYGPATSRAVLAFRKVNRMSRIGYASRTVFTKVFERRGTFRLKYPKAGKHVEADLSRQVLVLARDGKPERIYHTSSGKPSTPTVLGSFRVYRRQPGTNANGMVHSSYFIGGYAIHGYSSVPTYPASHGCLRVPIPDAWSIYQWVDFGDRVFVYR